MPENKNVRRGYAPADEKEFGEEALAVLRKAGGEISWLINRGYPIKNAAVFVGNHYMLSERQRLALVRSIAPEKSLAVRREKRLDGSLEGKTVVIDGFNLIITLEVALSGSTILRCMDGTIRDLAGLRGTYRLIDKTDLAIERIGKRLSELGIAKAVFYLDAPVSNSGRLKARIDSLLSACPFEVRVELTGNADVVLEKKDMVITSDAIILDKCKSWINLASDIIDREPELIPAVSFMYFEN